MDSWLGRLGSCSRCGSVVADSVDYDTAWFVDSDELVIRVGRLDIPVADIALIIV
jgi:hypothetical protein